MFISSLGAGCPKIALSKQKINLLELQNNDLLRVISKMKLQDLNKMLSTNKQMNGFIEENRHLFWKINDSRSPYIVFNSSELQRHDKAEVFNKFVEEYIKPKRNTIFEAYIFVNFTPNESDLIQKLTNRLKSNGIKANQVYLSDAMITKDLLELNVERIEIRDVDDSSFYHFDPSWPNALKEIGGVFKAKDKLLVLFDDLLNTNLKFEARMTYYENRYKEGHMNIVIECLQKMKDTHSELQFVLVPGPRYSFFPIEGCNFPQTGTIRLFKTFIFEGYLFIEESMVGVAIVIYCNDMDYKRIKEENIDKDLALRCSPSEFVLKYCKNMQEVVEFCLQPRTARLFSSKLFEEIEQTFFSL